MSVNIYVGNLPYSVTESELQNLFGQHGEVVSAKIIMDHLSGRSKGFGFVEMKDNNEANAAIEQLDGKDIMGRNVKVNLAKPRTDSPRPARY